MTHNKDNYLKEIYRVLKEDGVLSIFELAGDPDKISIAEIQSLVSAYGFQTDEVYSNKLNFSVNFSKRIN
jgi:ubiquinone/menaquinone biosynthesis C-methylase UbiE